jgi:hypothetical protein
MFRRTFSSIVFSVVLGVSWGCGGSRSSPGDMCPDGSGGPATGIEEIKCSATTLTCPLPTVPITAGPCPPSADAATSMWCSTTLPAVWVHPCGGYTEVDLSYIDTVDSLYYDGNGLVAVVSFSTGGTYCAGPPTFYRPTCTFPSQPTCPVTPDAGCL